MSSMVGEGEDRRIERACICICDISKVKPKFKSNGLEKREKNRMHKR